MAINYAHREKGKEMQLEQKDGKIKFWFYNQTPSKEEKQQQKRAVINAIEDIKKMKKTDWKLIVILLICFSTALGFHYYSHKIENHPQSQYIEQN